MDLQQDVPLLQLKNVTKVYDGHIRAVDDVSVDVGKGEIVAILGQSGCGKSTTLSLINRLVKPCSGDIIIDGQDSKDLDPVDLRRSIGYAFQGIGLFPHMSVAENVAVTPKLMKWERDRIDARVDELLELVHLNPAQYRDRMPHELSGGQQQRVGFARALASSPKIMLLDEPFGALDPVTRNSLQTELLEIRDRLQLTIVIVTHDVTEAFLLADRILVMQKGKIIQSGSPRQLVTQPASDYVEELIEMPKRQIEQLEDIIG